jgi:hypothetical protein
MLLLLTTRSDQELTSGNRLALLDRLESKGLRPVIRATRRTVFEQLSALPDAGSRMERLVSARIDQAKDELYLRGELFCFEDYALFLVFDEARIGIRGLRAGIVYTPDCQDAVRKLEVFCRNVQDALESQNNENPPILRDGFRGWIPIEIAGIESATTASTERHRGPAGYSAERIRALGLLDEPATRRFLQHLCEAYADGRVVELLFRTGTETTTGPLVRSLAEAALVRKEILVSCRRRNRPLFRLPSPEALGQITSSDAVCSECGVKLADERFDELIIPTPAATELLNDGSWLESRIRNVIRNLGVPDVNVESSSPDDSVFREIMVDLFGELFLICVFDGDVTLADTRIIHSRLSGTNANEMIVIATGRIHEDARIRLVDHNAQRAFLRQPLNISLVEGVDDLASNLEQLFNEASERAVVRVLFPLDRSLGFSTGHLLAARFQLGESETRGIFAAPKASPVEAVAVGFDNF